jgi:hypothetical protein
MAVRVVREEGRCFDHHYEDPDAVAALKGGQGGEL